MKPLLCKPVKSFDSYVYAAATDATRVPSRKYSRAVAREVRAMKHALPLTAGSTVFVRYCKARPGLMKALITGPEGTPYDSACFEFDILCPATFPETNPLVQLITTGNGTVRYGYAWENEFTL